VSQSDQLRVGSDSITAEQLPGNQTQVRGLWSRLELEQLRTWIVRSYRSYGRFALSRYMAGSVQGLVAEIPVEAISLGFRKNVFCNS
jgi:hypothetical protein